MNITQSMVKRKRKADVYEFEASPPPSKRTKKKAVKPKPPPRTQKKKKKTVQFAPTKKVKYITPREQRRETPFRYRYPMEKLKSLAEADVRYWKEKNPLEAAMLTKKQEESMLKRQTKKYFEDQEKHYMDWRKRNPNRK